MDRELGRFGSPLVELEVLRCVTCGVTFGIDERYARLALHEHRGGLLFVDDDDPNGVGKQDGTFCCPNGHQQDFEHKRSDVFKDSLVGVKRKLEVAELRIVELERLLANQQRESAGKGRRAKP